MHFKFKIKQYLWIIISIIAVIVTVLPGYSQPKNYSHQGFQLSTFSAIKAGVYQGEATLAEIKRYGDFGLGTFDGLDGELVLLNGKFYQIKTDGIANRVPDDIKTPFVVMTVFHKDKSLRLSGQINYQELQRQINNQLPSQNLPVAIRLEGSFPYLQVRSVPKQVLPYPGYESIVKNQQKVFELRNVKGTLVGFRFPEYMNGVNVPGYHFHFITSDRQTGGHLIDGIFLNPIADVETLQDWQIKFPSNSGFKQANMIGN